MTAEEQKKRAEFLEVVLLRTTVFATVVGLCISNYYANEENGKLKAANQDLVQQVQELKERRPIIYTADNAGGAMIGKVTGKAIVDGKHTLDCGVYGKFLVTKKQYEAIKVGDPIPEFLKGRGE